MMQGVLRRWLKLAFVTAVLGSAVATAQVFTMQSDLDDDKTPSSGSDKKPSEKLSASGAKTPVRAWFPHTDTAAAVGDGSGRLTSAPKPEVRDKVSRRRDPLGSPDDDSSVSKASSAQDDKDGLTPTTSKKNLDLNSSLLDGGTTTNAKVKTEPKAPSSSGSGSGSTSASKKKKLVAFTKSPSFSQKAPIPDGVKTADEDTKQSDDEDLTKTGTSKTPPKPKPSDATSESQPDVVSPPGSPAASKSVKAGVKKSSSSSGSKGEEKEEEEEEEEPDDPDASKLASNATKKGSTISKPVESTKDVAPSGSLTTDVIQEARSALPEPSPASSPASPQTPSSPPSSSPSVLADTSSADTSGISNNLMLGLMMAGAIALVVLVAAFVYIKTVNKDDDEDDPVLHPAHQHDLNLGGPMAQSSLTATADYHKNNNMTPSDGGDFFATKVHQPNLSRGLDMFPSQNSTALTQSQMSLPPMAQTGQSMASSGYSRYTTQSDFYGEDSAYSTATASTVDNVYPGYHHQGRGEGSEIAEHSEEEESDYEGDSIREMGDTKNAWHSAVHNRAGSSNSAGNVMDESQFDGANSRSTAASDYTGKMPFMASEYTEYRMSTDDGKSQGSKGGYDMSFAASESGYSAATDSRYDSRYDAGGKSFASSGFSEY